MFGWKRIIRIGHLDVRSTEAAVKKKIDEFNPVHTKESVFIRGIRVKLM